MKKEAVILLGPPFSGKSTIARRLSHETNVSHIDAGQLVRKQARERPDIFDLMTRGLQIPPNISLQLVVDALEEEIGDKVIINGFPRQKINAERLQGLTDVSGVFYLHVPQETILARHTHAYERADRSDHGLSVLQKRMNAFYSKDTYDVLGHYVKQGLLFRINEAPLEETYQAVKELYDRI